MMRKWKRWAVLTMAPTVFGPVTAQAQQQAAGNGLQKQLEAAMQLLEQQQRQLDRQASDIAELRRQLVQGSQLPNGPPSQPRLTPLPPAIAGDQGGIADGPATGRQAPVPIERVGQAPEERERPIELAVLETQGSVVTRAGQLTADVQMDYARADRSRAIFRGIELIEAVLVGVFDINENRQDVLTASAGLRYGLTDRFELGVRVPFIYRADTSILAPIAGSTNNDPAATIDNSVKGRGIGDIEVTARYQLLDGRNGSPFIIGNLQAVLPTGSDPFSIERDSLGRLRRAATGAGFYGIAPSVTAILPSDPIVLFGTLGYTFNLGKSVNTQIPPVIINRVDPGDAISVSAGIGIAFNQRSTLNIGYAHNWALGTKTRTSLIRPTATWPGERETRSRDLQIGRLLFGVTYRVTDRASINWSVEVGATEDATDLRTSIRIPVVLLTGR